MLVVIGSGTPRRRVLPVAMRFVQSFCYCFSGLAWVFVNFLRLEQTESEPSIFHLQSIQCNCLATLFLDITTTVPYRG